jgi:hypothetical protein
MDDEVFERWLKSIWGRAGDGVYLAPDTLSPTFLTPGQVHRLIAHLSRLAGPPAGALPSAEVEAIRGRAEEATQGPWEANGVKTQWSEDGHTEYAVVDAEGRALVDTLNRDDSAHVSEVRVEYDGDGRTAWNERSRRDAAFVAAARADVPRLLDALAHAEAQVAGLGHVVACLKNDRLAYQCGRDDGVEAERARCAALLRLAAGDWRRALPQAVAGGQRRRFETVIEALDAAADAVEKGE